MKLIPVAFLVVSFCAFGRCEGSINIRFVYPKPVPPRPLSYEETKKIEEQKSARRIALEKERRAFIEADKRLLARIEEERRERFERMLKNRPKIKPEDDDFAKWKQEQQWKKEAKEDPVLAEIRAKYRDDSDDFSRWKENQPDPVPAKKKDPSPEGKGANIDQLLLDSLKNNPVPKKEEQKERPQELDE